MAILNVPDRGTPVDTQTLYDIIEAINSISDSITKASYRVTTIESPGSGKKEVRTGDARIYGTYHILNINSVTAGQTVTFTKPLPGNFAYTPIVVATPVHQAGNAGAAPLVNVILTSVTTSNVGVKVTFQQAGAINIRINLLAIGVPTGVA